MPAKSNKSKLAILKNPWLCVVGILIGLYIGNVYKDIGVALALPGDLYLSLLKMSVIPIITTAIIGGLARMLRGGLAGKYMARLVVLFLVTVLFGSAFGMLAALIGKPGVDLGQASQAFLGTALMAGGDSTQTQDVGMWNIVVQMVPANVFNAFSTGQILGVIFVSVMIGAAVGMSQSEAGERFLDVIQGTQEAFVKILGWVLYGLPFGLACLIAGQVAVLGIEAILALGKYIIVFYIASIILCIIYLLIIKLATRKPFWRIISAIRDPLFVAFSASSSIAPIPIALSNMEEELDLPREVVNLVIPLTVAMNRHSYALLFSFTAIFLAQLFGTILSIGDYLLIFFISALAGNAAAGRLAAVAPMIGYILGPIGIPVSVGITIFITVGAILDPIIQMCILFGGCANAAVISGAAGKDEGSAAVENDEESGAIENDKEIS